MTVSTSGKGASARSPPLAIKDPSSSAAGTATAVVRKRRRRTPAGGASDDCFACSKRSVKCDRRRPYCSQCLEIGDECSGYKTQLTWGVGVASRGKLRGLSLPVARSPPVPPSSSPSSQQKQKQKQQQQGKKTSPARSMASPAATSCQWGATPSEKDEHSPMLPMDEEMTEGRPTPPTPNYFPAAYAIPLPISGETTPSIPQGSWSTGGGGGGGGIRFPPKLTTHLSHMPVTNNDGCSVDSLSDAEYMSPLGHSFPGEEIQFMDSPGMMYESYTTHGSPVSQSPVSNTMFIEHRQAPTSCPSLVYAPSEPGSNMASNVESYESHLAQKVMSECDSLGVPDLDAFSSSYQSSGPGRPPSLEEEAHAARSFEQTPAHWPSTREGPSEHIHINPDLAAKMPFFMDYYRNTMCPKMVLIDGPGNPYREHILQLAQSSQGLRHAICALSACNLRMKRKFSLNQHMRESSESKYVKVGSEVGPEEAAAGDHSVSEEYQHRNLAVHLLNQQLNDPSKSIHDSVLAMILLLCHYRMVESGIAKFHTQFAGVKKILSMRRSAQCQISHDSAWIEDIFTYFDAISASINGREAQLDSSFFGLTPDSHLLVPGAENLVGCDRELFKTVGKLGRLNVLSQNGLGQAMGSNLAAATPSRSQSQSPSGVAASRLGGHAYKTTSQSSIPDFFSRIQAHRLDGNGFGTTLDDDEMLAAAAAAAASAACSSPTYEDTRPTFWREWRDARLALQNWEFDSQRLMATLPGSTTTAQIRDLGCLSEAFRYAALLYTERLAGPVSPSSQANFQNLVSQVVFYATSLGAGSSAEKFLLWPLFVAGSECVNKLQQNIVRTKCREIMSRSGYMNNLAALEVLEQIWADEAHAQDGAAPGNMMGGSAGSGMGPSRHGPLRWTGCIGGPGVEVEWIMF